MSSLWDILDATEADAAIIAELFTQSWTSTFSKLQFGHVDPPILAAAIASRIAEQINTSSSHFLVARHRDTHRIAAVAQWAIDINDREKDMPETQQDSDERQRFDNELLCGRLPESSNRALIMEFTIGMRGLRQHVLQGRKHFLLENLATHPAYRGLGVASQLVEWAFPLADRHNCLVYLETASDNPAMRLYKRLGFEEQGHYTIEDLSRFVDTADLEASGSESFHTHVAFVRHPYLAFKS
jgi:ribosomal protein S18 acetylase RimI-like enzyme